MTSTDDEFRRWFPPNATAPFANSPNYRLICFHGAGSDSLIFTTQGTARNPLPNPLLSYCIENRIHLLSMHLPGRTTRTREPLLTSAHSIAKILLGLLRPHLLGEAPVIPFAFAAHSAGCLIAYELIRGLLTEAKSGEHLPRHLFFSCMVAPGTPKSALPWRPSVELSTRDFEAECRQWDINDAVFTPAVWATYEPILRADFRIFDEYDYEGKGASLPTGALENLTSSPPLGLTPFVARRDSRVTSDFLLGWYDAIAPVSAGRRRDVEKIEVIDGRHNFFYDAESRIQWMKIVIAKLETLLLDVEYAGM